MSLTSTWPLSTRGTAALSILLATAAMGLLLTFAKTEFRMVAHGRLQPLVREWVFAPATAWSKILQSTTVNWYPQVRAC